MTLIMIMVYIQVYTDLTTSRNIVDNNATEDGGNLDADFEDGADGNEGGWSDGDFEEEGGATGVSEAQEEDWMKWHNLKKRWAEKEASTREKDKVVVDEDKV